MKLYSIDREVIFEEEVDSIKKLIELAIKRKTNLSGVDLSGVDLSGVDLSGVNLSGVNLSRVNLSGVNLSGVNLSGVDLYRVDLSGVDLYGVNLSDISLIGVIGNMKEIKSMQLENYKIAFTKDILQIGCENHTHEEWKDFTDKEILEMDGKEALKFWKKWKKFIFEAIELGFSK